MLLFLSFRYEHVMPRVVIVMMVMLVSEAQIITAGDIVWRCGVESLPWFS